MGKSTLSIYIAREYITKFGYICPHCGSEFYKNLYKKKTDGKTYTFYIPKEIKEDKVAIQCPEIYELNLKTKNKDKISGCGKLFLWSERKKIKWSADKFIAYHNSDAQRKMLKMPRYSPLIFDEAFNFMASQDHNKVESKDLKRKMTVIRPRRLLMITNLPNIKWIDSKYREIMSHFWFQCLDRGLAVCYEKDKGISKDVWHLKEVEKYMGVVKYFSSLDQIKKKLKKTPTYFDTFSFPKLPEHVYDDYEYFRNAHNLQKQAEEMELGNNDIAKLMVWNLMYSWDRIHTQVIKSRDNKMTYTILRDSILVDPLTKKTLMSDTTIRNWLRGVESYIETSGKDAKFLNKKDSI